MLGWALGLRGAILTMYLLSLHGAGCCSDVDFVSIRQREVFVSDAGFSDSVFDLFGHLTAQGS